MPQLATEYNDFVIHIGPDDGQGHRIYARTDSAGEAEGLLTWNADWERWASSADAWRPVPEPGEDPRQDLEALGARLHSELFKGEVLELYTKSRALAESQGRGLRLRLELSPDHPELLRVFSLPWELLYAERKRFLLLDRDTQLVRHPTLVQPLEHRPKIRKLRILVVLAEPEDQPALEAEREWQALAAIWRDHPSVRMKQLKNPTLSSVLELLDDEEFHVLHFIGHGGFDPRFKHWVLCFPDKENKTYYASATEIAEGLRNARRSLRLVVLNACQSARVVDLSQEQSVAGAGVAMALVLAGVNGVLATQAIITDRAAIELTRGLYHRLAAGDSIDAALSNARRRIRRKEWTKAVLPAEWAVPVLFLRGKSPRLFETYPETATGREPASWRPSVAGLAALTLGGLGLAGLASLAALWVWQVPVL